MATYFFFGAISLILYLFMFWRQLKDDYVSNQIFTTGFFAIFLAVFLGYGSYRFFPNWWFWSGFVGVFLSVLFNSRRFRMRTIEVLEAVVIGFLPVLGAIALSDFISRDESASLYAVLVCLVLIVLFYILNSTYKSFSWYRSGRVGFAGLATVGIVFLLRALVAIKLPDMVSFAGKPDIYLSGAVSVSAFATLIYLARQT